MINFRQFKIINGLVGPKMPKISYSKYTEMLKHGEQIFNKNASTKFVFIPTPNRIANFYGGGNAETLNTLRSAEFVDKIFAAL